MIIIVEQCWTVSRQLRLRQRTPVALYSGSEQRSVSDDFPHISEIISLSVCQVQIDVCNHQNNIFISSQTTFTREVTTSINNVSAVCLSLDNPTNFTQPKFLLELCYLFVGRLTETSQTVDCIHCHICAGGLDLDMIMHKSNSVFSSQ